MLTSQHLFPKTFPFRIQQSLPIVPVIIVVFLTATISLYFPILEYREFRSQVSGTIMALNWFWNQVVWLTKMQPECQFDSTQNFIMKIPEMPKVFERTKDAK